MAAYDIEKDIGPRVQIIQEIHELILAGEMEVAKGMLRTLIKVTSVILRFLTRFGRNAKSTMRMLSPDVDPGIKRLSPLSELQNISQKKQRTRVKPTEPKTYATNRSQWPVFLCLRGVCCV